MLIFLPIILIALSVLAASAILSRRYKLNVNVVALESESVSLTSIFETRINQFSHQFSFFFKQLGHYIYFYWLLVMRKLVVISRIILTLFERKFSHLIESVRGKGVIGKRGSASLFLSSLSGSETSLRADR